MPVNAARLAKLSYGAEVTGADRCPHGLSLTGSFQLPSQVPLQALLQVLFLAWAPLL